MKTEITDAQMANYMNDFLDFLEEKLGSDVVLDLTQEYNSRLDIQINKEAIAALNQNQ